MVFNLWRENFFFTCPPEWSLFYNCQLASTSILSQNRSYSKRRWGTYRLEARRMLHAVITDNVDLLLYCPDKNCQPVWEKCADLGKDNYSAKWIIAELESDVLKACVSMGSQSANCEYL